MEQIVASLQEETNPPLNNPEVLENLGNLSLEIEKNSDDYEVLLSDEASGRIPSLLFRKIINKSRREKGLEAVDFRAVASGRDLSPEKKEAVAQLLDKIIEDHDGMIQKILLVTEYIETGHGLSWLVDLMKERGLDFDIAAVSIVGSKNHLSSSVSNNLLSATKRGMAGIYLYGEYARTGTYKNTNTESPFPEKYIDADIGREEIKETRKDINKIANSFYNVIKRRK